MEGFVLEFGESGRVLDRRRFIVIFLEFFRILWKFSKNIFFISGRSKVIFCKVVLRSWLK